MKRSVSILILLSLVFGLGAQKKKDQRLMEKTYQTLRISLKEKFNLPARDLPSVLIRAFCEGNIVGYYPQKPNEQCSYHEFADHFAVKNVQPPGKGDAFEEVNCPAAFCYTRNEASIEPFRMYIDIFEAKKFSRETSTESHDIKYLRINYVMNKHGMEIVQDGPLFLYEDVTKLTGTDYTLPNPKNDAARITMKQFFEKRMFNAFELKTIEGPANPKNANQEKDKWEH